MTIRPQLRSLRTKLPVNTAHIITTCIANVINVIFQYISYVVNKCEKHPPRQHRAQTSQADLQLHRQRELLQGHQHIVLGRPMTSRFTGHLTQLRTANILGHFHRYVCIYIYIFLQIIPFFYPQVQVLCFLGHTPICIRLQTFPMPFCRRSPMLSSILLAIHIKMIRISLDNIIHLAGRYPNILLNPILSLLDNLRFQVTNPILLDNNCSILHTNTFRK